MDIRCTTCDGRFRSVPAAAEVSDAVRRVGCPRCGTSLLHAPVVFAHAHTVRREVGMAPAERSAPLPSSPPWMYEPESPAAASSFEAPDMRVPEGADESLPPSENFLLRGAVAGGLLGLLTGAVYVFVFAGLDWTSGTALAVLLSAGTGTLGVLGALLAGGTLGGLLVSRFTGSGSRS